MKSSPHRIPLYSATRCRTITSILQRVAELLLLLVFFSLTSCKSSDITLDEAYNEMIRTSYYQDEDSLAYYHSLVNQLQQSHTKVDSVFTSIHDSVYIEREGSNTRTYNYHSEIIYRTSKETLEYISTLRDSLSQYKTTNQSLLDSLHVATTRNTSHSQIIYRTPWYWYVLGAIGMLAIIIILMGIAGAIIVEIKEHLRK